MFSGSLARAFSFEEWKRIQCGKSPFAVCTPRFPCVGLSGESGLLCRQKPNARNRGKPDPTQPYATNYLIDDHEPIISREVWDTVQERLKREERDRIADFCKQGNSHELYGRLSCASCGEPYMRCTFTRRNPAPGEDKHYKVWRCRGRLKGSGCKNPVIREDALKGILDGAGKLLVTAEGKVVTG